MSRKIVCRCEDITEDEIIKAIEEGFTDFEELRKRLRIGMGPCQGRTCIPLVLKILSKKTGKKIEDLGIPKFRPPVTPLTLGSLSGEEE